MTTGLILSRRVGEEIVIGGGITIAVVGIRGKQARILVSAPKDVTVHRAEIQERIDKEKAAREDAA